MNDQPPRRPPMMSPPAEQRIGHAGRIRPMKPRQVEDDPSLRRDPTMPQLPPGALLTAFADLLPGQGNLDIRMLIAALVGPLRVASGAMFTKVVADQTATQIANNSTGTHPWFVQVSLPFENAGPVEVMFSKSDVLDKTNSIPIALTNNVGQNGSTFRCILGPKEELYCQAPGAGGLTVAVSQVMF